MTLYNNRLEQHSIYGQPTKICCLVQLPSWNYFDCVCIYRANFFIRRTQNNCHTLYLLPDMFRFTMKLSSRWIFKFLPSITCSEYVTMLGQTSIVSTSHKNKERRPHKDMSGNECFFGGGFY